MSAARGSFRFVRPIGLGALAALVLFFAMIALKAPRHDHNWQPDAERVAQVKRDGETFHIRQYRDWEWTARGAASDNWMATPALNVSEVRQAWFVVEPHPGLAVMAHTLVIFEFESGDLIGLSIEARKEADEDYSVIGGAFRQFELLYQWASPKDLLTRRAITLERDLYMYPLALTQAETETYLGALLARTAALETRPRFYNTLTSNCTNELAKTAGLDWRPAFVVTGKSAEALDAMGRISGDGDFATKKARAEIDDVVRALSDQAHAAFNARLIYHLRKDDDADAVRPLQSGPDD